MSFVFTDPELLTGAAGDLHGIGTAVHAQATAITGPTTAMAPPAADAVSAAIATRFSAHGAAFQNVAAQAAAVHQMFVATLHGGATAYATAEAINAAAAG